MAIRSSGSILRIGQASQESITASLRYGHAIVVVHFPGADVRTRHHDRGQRARHGRRRRHLWRKRRCQKALRRLTYRATWASFGRGVELFNGGSAPPADSLEKALVRGRSGSVEKVNGVQKISTGRFLSSAAGIVRTATNVRPPACARVCGEGAHPPEGWRPIERTKASAVFGTPGISCVFDVNRAPRWRRPRRRPNG